MSRAMRPKAKKLGAYRRKNLVEGNPAILIASMLAFRGVDAVVVAKSPQGDDYKSASRGGRVVADVPLPPDYNKRPRIPMITFHPKDTQKVLDLFDLEIGAVKKLTDWSWGVRSAGLYQLCCTMRADDRRELPLSIPEARR